MGLSNCLGAVVCTRKFVKLLDILKLLSTMLDKYCSSRSPRKITGFSGLFVRGASEWERERVQRVQDEARDFVRFAFIVTLAMGGAGGHFFPLA